MNNYEKAIDALDLAPYRREWCYVCGKPRTDGHHVIYRSHGGRNKHIISLCRECHRLAHVGRLKFKADFDVLWSLEISKAISIDTAHGLPICFWSDLSKRAEYFKIGWLTR